MDFDEKPSFVLGGNAIMVKLSRFSWSPLILIILLALLSFQITSKAVYPVKIAFTSSTSKDDIMADSRTCVGFFGELPERKAVLSIRDFGGVGDGKTSNTEAFREAMRYVQSFGERGGAQLNVPEGRWVTGSFNLTSNFTLFLEEGAVILGSQAVLPNHVKYCVSVLKPPMSKYQYTPGPRMGKPEFPNIALDPKEWPIIEPLPSYGRGRERLGGRHISLIHGDGLTNVVITGNNGTIDGQGKMWWELWWNRTLEHTRGHLVELMNSQDILISNLTFLNSPFWTIHPIYCSNLVVKDMTILAPLNAPNTDGIDPDSSTNVCIEDCYIESGDDLVAVKSGWDQYGIKMARPSSNIIIRRVSGTTPTCSGVGIGSEMSGGVHNVTIEDLHVWDSAAGVRIKTDKGRGGYIANITISNITMERVKIPIRFSSGSNDHPDERWDPKAVPVVKGVYISNVVSFNSTKAPVLEGIEDAPFDGICMKNIRLLGVVSSPSWRCEFVSGFADDVFPAPCPQLQIDISSSRCSYS